MSFTRTVLTFAAIHLAWNLILAALYRLGPGIPEPSWLSGGIWLLMSVAAGYAVASARVARAVSAYAALLAGLLGVFGLSLVTWLSLALAQLGAPEADRITASAQLPPLLPLLAYSLVSALLGLLGGWLRRDALASVLGGDDPVDAF